jgi:hypothetical protein
MNKSKITIEIDRDDLAGYTDEFLHLAWNVAQANPAPWDDRDAGELAELIGREIITRWIKRQAPVLWNHQARHYWQSQLTEHGKFDGEGDTYRPHAVAFAQNVAEDLRAISRMDPLDSRIPKMLAGIQAEAAKLCPPAAGQVAPSS